MENLLKLLFQNLAYAFEGAAQGRAVSYVEDEVEETMTETTSDKPVTEESPKEETTEKKLPNPKRKVYSIHEPAKTKVEKELYMIQWAELGDKQEDYLAGKIDSLGNALENAEKEEDFGDFGDFTEEKKAEFTAEQVREALMKYAKTNGKDEAYKVLAQFGAKKIADIKEEQFADVMAEVQ